MIEQNININLKKIYCCSICKENFFWCDESSWYGAYKEKMGDEKELEICCSRICYNQSKYRNKRKIHDTI